MRLQPGRRTSGTSPLVVVVDRLGLVLSIFLSDIPSPSSRSLDLFCLRSPPPSGDLQSPFEPQFDFFSFGKLFKDSWSSGGLRPSPFEGSLEGIPRFFVTPRTGPRRASSVLVSRIFLCRKVSPLRSPFSLRVVRHRFLMRRDYPTYGNEFFTFILYIPFTYGTFPFPRVPLVGS